MELSERLQRHVFEKKYENAPGVNLKKVLLSNEYTEIERKEMNYVYKADSIPNERFKFLSGTESLKVWVKERIVPYLAKGHEVVLLDRFGALVTISDVEKMLEFYYDSNPYRLGIINRSLGKFLRLATAMDGENFLLYIRDV